MRPFLAILITLLSLTSLSAQEMKTIQGRIISEELEVLPKAQIYDKDTTLLGETDLKGYFEFDIPAETDELLLGYIAMEWTSVTIVDDCESLEMIIMSGIIYDFITAKKENKLRCKRVKKLPKKHKEAYEQGLFKTPSPCVKYSISN